MISTKNLFLLILILLLTNIIIANNNTITITGKIEKIKYSKTKATIYIMNTTTPLITFQRTKPSLKEGQKIKIEAIESEYKNSKQYIIKKVTTKND